MMGVFTIKLSSSLFSSSEFNHQYYSLLSKNENRPGRNRFFFFFFLLILRIRVRIPLLVRTIIGNSSESGENLIYPSNVLLMLMISVLVIIVVVIIFHTPITSLESATVTVTGTVSATSGEKRGD